MRVCVRVCVSTRVGRSKLNLIEYSSLKVYLNHNRLSNFFNDQPLKLKLRVALLFKRAPAFNIHC